MKGFVVLIEEQGNGKEWNGMDVGKGMDNTN